MKDVAEVPHNHQANIGRGGSGEAVDQPGEVLVWAQPADIEEEPFAGIQSVAKAGGIRFSTRFGGPEDRRRAAPIRPIRCSGSR